MYFLMYRGGAYLHSKQTRVPASCYGNRSGNERRHRWAGWLGERNIDITLPSASLPIMRDTIVYYALWTGQLHVYEHTCLDDSAACSVFVTKAVRGRGQLNLYSRHRRDQTVQWPTAPMRVVSLPLLKTLLVRTITLAKDPGRIILYHPAWSACLLWSA